MGSGRHQKLLAVRVGIGIRRGTAYQRQTGLSSSTVYSMPGRSTAEATLDETGARERLLATAYELFSRRGIRDVGVDEVIASANVAKATLYRHFRTKDQLVLAFLERRETRWTREWVEQRARQRAKTPEGQLLAIFDLFDEWFHCDDFEACSFINVLLEMGPQHPAGKESIRQLENIRFVVRGLAEEAGLRDPDSFARSWHILMKGSIISAAEGDTDAARRAQSMARLVIDQHRPT
jgi:AcrR family transcriptional regulator